MARYKWDNAHEWLFEYIADKDETELHNIVQSLANKADADTIQDIFQSDMDADGFFVDLDKPTCADCGDTATWKLTLLDKKVCGDCLENYPEDEPKADLATA